MARFGWAHISDNNDPAQGPDGSLQFASGSEGFISGSNELKYDHNAGSLNTTGFVNAAGFVQPKTIDCPTCSVGEDTYSLLYGPISVAEGTLFSIGLGAHVKIKDFSDE